MTTFLHDVITGKNQSWAAWLVKPVLWLLSLVYRAFLFVIRFAYEAGFLKSTSVGKPVISVGNITTGGTGKTPFVMYLADKIMASGHRPSILMRGYMSHAGTASDEAEMVRRRLKNVPVCVSPDRVRAAEESMLRDIPDVFILDDGFQHWKLHRNLDIVLIDAVNPFGEERLLPFGLLREPVEQLLRAHLFVISRVDIAPVKVVEIRAKLGRINPKAGIVESAHVPLGVEEPFAAIGKGPGRDFTPVQQKVVAVSAIGSPEGFKATLEHLGADVADHVVFIDHHVYTAGDIQTIVERCRARHCDRIVVTEKDFVKLSMFENDFREIRVFVLSVSVKILKGENEIVARLDHLLHS